MKRTSPPPLPVWQVAGILLATFPLESAPFPTADPENLGLSRTGLEALTHTMQNDYHQDIIVGGNLLVIKDKHVVWTESVGWRDREQGLPMLPDTLFNIRSMTKMITGAACQMLIDEGLVALTDPVAHYLPGFDTPRSRMITVEQLLTHRSGLPLSILTSLDEYPTLYAMANAIGQRGPQFTPGSRFYYSDAGTDSLGAVVEVASGMALDAYVRTHLLEPLHMQDTYYLHEAATPRNRIGSLYYGKVAAWTRIWTGDQPFYPYAWGSQSLYSTPTDYARFLTMLLDNGLADGDRILSETAVARILTPVSSMTSLGSSGPYPTDFLETTCHYGHMCILYQSPDGVEALGHSGSDGTWAWAWPEHNLLVFYFTQSRGQATGIRLEKDLDAWLLHPWRQPSPETVERYAPYLGWYRAYFESAFGSYQNHAFAVVLHDGRLGLDLPGQFVFGLHDSTLTGRWVFELQNELSVSFEQDGTGRVTALRYYEGDQVFRLPRIENYAITTPGCAPTRWLPFSNQSPDPHVITWALQGTPGYRYRIETSEDLLEWQPFQTHVLGGSRLEITDEQGDGLARRFYRALVSGP